MSILYNGENLIKHEYCPYYYNQNIQLGVDEVFVHSLKYFYENLFQYKIIGKIRKHDVNIFNLIGKYLYNLSINF